MQLELKPSPKLTYKLRLTPQMKLAINLLQMPLVKLQDYVKQQIEENPLLEAQNLEAPLKGIESDLSYNADEFDEPRPCAQERGEDKQNYKESLITKSATLSDHLLNQLHLFTPLDSKHLTGFINSDKEHKIGEVIIANIDDNGYLRSSIEEIAKSTESTPQEVQKVLSLIQTFDPVGVGARDLRECLLLQIKAKGEENSLAGQIIDKYLPYLEKKRFEFLAKKLRVPVERIKEAIKEIANLEPKPGRSFNTEKTVRLIPDAILKRNNDKYEVMLNDWELPSLNLNPQYKRMLKQKDIAEDTKAYLKGRLKAARALINAINKRKETLQKVTEAIVYIQKDFLNNGMQNLKPMTLSQIANMVGKHKSTVSRAVNNKYLQTSDGIFELRQFLNSAVLQENGVLFSSKAIKSRIKDLIENENKENPLTDQKIAHLLKQKGISISRRTIAKYRSQLKILPFQSRRE
jgi:RNA polymerase sigma-54 factor